MASIGRDWLRSVAASGFEIQASSGFLPSPGLGSSGNSDRAGIDAPARADPRSISGDPVMRRRSRDARADRPGSNTIRAVDLPRIYSQPEGQSNHPFSPDPPVEDCRVGSSTPSGRRVSGSETPPRARHGRAIMGSMPAHSPYQEMHLAMPPARSADKLASRFHIDDNQGAKSIARLREGRERLPPSPVFGVRSKTHKVPYLRVHNHDQHFPFLSARG